MVYKFIFCVTIGRFTNTDCFFWFLWNNFWLFLTFKKYISIKIYFKLYFTFSWSFIIFIFIWSWISLLRFLLWFSRSKFFQVGINIIICCTCIYLCIFSDSFFWKLWDCFLNSNLFFWTIWIQFLHTKSWWFIWFNNIYFFLIIWLCICSIESIILLSITKFNRRR